jgi:hypothetical protein
MSAGGLERGHEGFASSSAACAAATSTTPRSALTRPTKSRPSRSNVPSLKAAGAPASATEPGAPARAPSAVSSMPAAIPRMARPLVLNARESYHDRERHSTIRAA